MEPETDIGDFLIIFAPNGSFPTPGEVVEEFGDKATDMGFAHTPKTLAAEALAGFEYGASMLHMHPRLTGKPQNVEVEGKDHEIKVGDPAQDYRFFEQARKEIGKSAGIKGKEFADTVARASYENSATVLSKFKLEEISDNILGPLLVSSPLGISYTNSITLTSPNDVPKESSATSDYAGHGVWQWMRPRKTFDYDTNSPNWIWGPYFKNTPELRAIYEPEKLAVSEGLSTIHPAVNYFLRCVREMDINFTLELQTPRMMYVWEEMLEKGMLKGKQLSYAEWEEKVKTLGVYDKETGKTWLERARELAARKWDPREPLEQQKFFEMGEGFVQMLFGHEVFYPVKTKDGKHLNEQFLRDELDWITLKFQPYRMSAVGAWIYDTDVVKAFLNFATTYTRPDGRKLDALRVGHEHLPPSAAGHKGQKHSKPDIDVEFNIGNSEQVKLAAEIAKANGRVLVKPKDANKFLGYHEKISSSAIAAREAFARFQQPFVDRFLGREIRKLIAIIGVGDAGTSLLDSLANSDIENAEITIFEKAPIAGPGLPYSRVHNLLSDKMNLQGNETFRDQRDHFMEWVGNQSNERLINAGILHTLESESPEALEKYRAGQVEIKTLLESHWIYTRVLVGEFLQDLYSESVRKLEAKGCKVITHLSTEATDATKIDGKWQVTYKTSDGQINTYNSDKLVLTCGYSKLAGEEKTGYYANAYPAQKIVDEADLKQPIAQIGSNVYGGEVPTKFKAGIYQRQEDGTLKFTPHAGNENFHITVYSRTGMFPGVKGYTDEYKAIYLTEENINLLIKRSNGGFLSLEALTRLFKREVAHAAPELAAAYPEWESFSFVDLSKILREQYSKLGAQEILKLNIELAKESRNTKTPIPWQNPLMLTFVWVDQYLDRLSAEDRIKWDKHFDAITRSVMLLQVDVAEKLLALMKANVLEIEEISKGVEVRLEESPSSGASVVTKNADGTETSKHYATVIRAGGTEPDIKLNSTALIRGLTEQGYLRSALIPFINYEVGETAYNLGNDKIVKVEYKSEYNRIGYQYYYNAGGIDMDSNCRVIPSKSIGEDNIGLYAIIPDTYGKHPIGGGLTVNRKMANLIVADITKSEKQLPANPNLHVVEFEADDAESVDKQSKIVPFPNWVKRVDVAILDFSGLFERERNLRDAQLSLFDREDMMHVTDPVTKREYVVRRSLFVWVTDGNNDLFDIDKIIAADRAGFSPMNRPIFREGGPNGEISVYFVRKDDGNYERRPITKDNVYKYFEIGRLAQLSDVATEQKQSQLGA